MKELLTKYCKSEIRKIKKNNTKVHPRDTEKKNTKLFCKSFFGKRNINKK